jgi:hypothetical protein
MAPHPAIDEETQPNGTISSLSHRDPIHQVAFKVPLSSPPIREDSTVTLTPSLSPAIGAQPQLRSINQPNPMEKELPPPPQVRIYAAAYQKSLRMMEIARSQIICQRLCEDWDGIEQELKDDIDFERRLWALAALKRLGDGFQNESQDSRAMNYVVSTISTADEPKTTLNICDTIGMSSNVLLFFS